jgi:signal transduction histidine kinase
MLKRGLTFQFLAFIILPLMGLLLIISLGSTILHRRTMRQVIVERDERAVRAAATLISEQVTHLTNAVRGVGLQAQASGNAVGTITEATYLLPDFSGGVALYARDGTLLANSQEYAPNPAIAVWIQEQENTSVAFPQFQTRSDLLIIAAATTDFMAIGVVHPADIAATALDDLFTDTNSLAAFLVDGSGRVLFERNTLHQHSRDLPTHPGVAEAMTQHSGTLYLPTEDGEHVVAYSFISLVEWALVLEEPWQEVADPLLRTTELASLALVPALLIAVLALWLGVRQIVQPLQALSQKATQLGQGNFAGMSESVGGIQEIQHLQRELNHMSRQLQTAQAGLRGYLGAVTDGQEEERRRLARELHDDTMQSLIGLNQRLQFIQLTAQNSQSITKINEAQAMSNQIILDLRRLTRDLRPIYLEDLGLMPAIQTLTQDTTAQLTLSIQFKAKGMVRRLLPEVELALYRITQEALSNIGRHASASKATVQLAFTDDSVTLTIQDDGRGFVVPAHPAALAPDGHFGLLGMYERAELVGGKLTLRSNVNQGTKIQVNIPFK